MNSIMNLRSLGFAPLLCGLLVATPVYAQAPAPAAPAGGASAEPTDVEQARLHFTQGTKLYKDGDFDAALVQFERAYDVKPNYKVLYNIGQAYFQLRQYVEARDAMERYVREGGNQIDTERLTQVNKDIADLQKRIARVKVSVNVEGASVLVDGKKQGVTPLPGPIDVSEGQRTVSIEAPNRGVLQRLVRVAGGDEQSLTLNFDDSPSSAAPGKSQPTEAKSGGLGAGFWATAIGAVVLGAGAGVTGALALSAQSDNKDQQKAVPGNAKELDDTSSRAKTFALTTDILGGAAIVCAGVATVIWVTTPSSHSAQVGLNVGPSSMSLVGRF